MNKIIPQRMFFTKGVGYHRNKLQSFELALRACGIEQCNLVSVSSIFPPDCRIIPKEKGIQELFELCILKIQIVKWQKTLLDVLISFC